MTISVIGAGFGRTGTYSLKTALEQLGFGPCYHMESVIKTPANGEHWVRAASGATMDWDTVFAGYGSAVDWPVADFYQQLAGYYPKAKVVLSERDPDQWFDSTQQTIFSEAANQLASASNAVGETMRLLAERNFNRRIHDRETCIAAFKKHNEAVKRSIPPERLLVYEARQGWEPLCRFLGKPVPAEAFPVTNTTEGFREHLAQFAAQRLA